MNSHRRVKTVCALLGALAAGGAAHADVRIGFSGPLSGPQAVVGQDQADGFALALEQLGGKLGGQATTVIKEDDQLKPEIGVQIVRKFLERDRVDAIVGLGYSNVLMATLRRLSESGVPAIATSAGPSPMAGSQCAANVFSVSFQNDGFGEAIGKLMQEKGYKNVYLMAPNYQAGKDMLAGFKRFYKGTVAEEVYTQVNQADYSAEITQLQSSKADALFMFYTGGMGVNFTKQLSQSGMVGKLPVYSTFTVDGANLPALRESAVGVVSGNMWDATLENAENARFVKTLIAKYQRVPSAYAATGYDAANLLDVAVRKVNGKVTDKPAFVAAVKAAGNEFKSVRGPFKFNTNNLPIQDYYAFEMVKDDGQIRGKLIATPLKDHKDAYYSACALK